MPRFVIVLSIIYIVMAIYGFQAFRTLFKSAWAQWAYGLFFLGALLFLIIKVLAYTPGDGFRGSWQLPLVFSFPFSYLG